MSLLKILDVLILKHVENIGEYPIPQKMGFFLSRVETIS